MKNTSMKHQMDLLREARSAILEVCNPEKKVETPPPPAATTPENNKPPKTNKKVTRS